MFAFYGDGGTTGKFLNFTIEMDKFAIGNAELDGFALDRFAHAKDCDLYDGINELETRFVGEYNNLEHAVFEIGLFANPYDFGHLMNVGEDDAVDFANAVFAELNS